MAKKKNKILIKIDNLQLAKQLSRKMFKDATKKEQVIKDKTKYTRKSKHKEQLFS